MLYLTVYYVYVSVQFNNEVIMKYYINKEEIIKSINLSSIYFNFNKQPLRGCDNGEKNIFQCFWVHQRNFLLAKFLRSLTKQREYKSTEIEIFLPSHIKLFFPLPCPFRGNILKLKQILINRRLFLLQQYYNVKLTYIKIMKC